MEMTNHYKQLDPTKKRHSFGSLHLKKPMALTIGNFDGVHLGHQKIFHFMRNLTKDIGSNVVITFSNHPLEILHPESKVFKLTPLEEKLDLLKKNHIDLTILLEFNSEIQRMDYKEFLMDVKKYLPFDFLILGEGASFGRNQGGTFDELKKIETELDFKTFYVPRLKDNNTIISSKHIRGLIEKGAFTDVERYLGRNYTLYAPYHLLKLQETGETFLKITYDFQNMCLIPSGHYLIRLVSKEHECSAVAYLTTLKSDGAGKTFDLEIFIKVAKSPFMNDEVRIEFVKKIQKTDVEAELEKTSCKIIPFKSA